MTTQVSEPAGPDQPARPGAPDPSGSSRPATTEPPPVVVHEPPAPNRIRSSGDALRLVAALIVLGGAVVVTRAVPDGIRGVERDVVRLLERTSKPVETFVVICIQLLAIATPVIVLATMVVLRRFVRLAVAVVTAVVTALVTRLLISGGYPGAGSPAAIAELTDGNLSIVHNFPSLGYVSAVVAVTTVEAAAMSRPWRRASIGLVVAFAFAHIAAQDVARAGLPVDIGIAIALGWVFGCAARLVFGQPNRRPRGTDIAATMVASGLRPVSVSAGHRAARASHPYHVTTADGRRIFVKLTVADDRGGDILSRLYRYLRLRDVGDEHPLWTVRRRAEHEALLSFCAVGAGVPTPTVVTVGEVGVTDAMLVAFHDVGGPRLTEIEPDRITDDVLQQAWALTGSLQAGRIAHRDLRAGNLLLDGAGTVWLVDLDAATTQADDHALAGDTAELLCSLAVRVGPVRAVAAAHRALGSGALAASLPRLQPLALSSTTRAEVKQGDDIIAGVAAEVCRVTGHEPVPLEQLQRVRTRSIVIFAMSAFAVYALLPQLADASGIIQELGNARWGWVAGALLASVATFLAAAIALTGSVPDRLRFGRTTLAQVATQFANFATPASVGGMALNVRYIQKQGTDAPVAVAAVGLDTVAGFVAHLGLLAGMTLLAGSTTTNDGLSVPSPTTAAGVAVAIVAVGALMLAIPAIRARVVDRVLPVVRRSARGIVDIARRPVKLLAVLGGSALLTACYAAALVCSVYAFGATTGVTTLVLVYLVASAIAAVAPTPGGLGAVEAALVAGLTGVGIDGAVAVSAVVVFRFATFWFPLLPGWFAFHALERRDAI